MYVVTHEFSFFSSSSGISRVKQELSSKAIILESVTFSASIALRSKSSCAYSTISIAFSAVVFPEMNQISFPEFNHCL